MNKFNRD